MSEPSFLSVAQEKPSGGLPGGATERCDLNLGKLHGCGASFVIIRHVINAGAHRITPHQLSIVGLQQFRSSIHVLHSGVEPEVIEILLDKLLPPRESVPSAH